MYNQCLINYKSAPSEKRSGGSIGIHIMQCGKLQRTRPPFVVPLIARTAQVPDLDGAILAATIHPPPVPLEAQGGHAAVLNTLKIA